jgi:hypothetical protein
VERKIKFLGFKSDQSEEGLNAWLRENPNFEINCIAMALNPGGNFLTIAILYQEKETPGK